MIDIYSPDSPVLVLGRVGDNETATYQFDFSGAVAKYGAGEFMLVHRRPDMAVSYPADIDIDGTVATWEIKDTDLAEGYGEAEPRYKVGDQVKWYRIYKTFTDKSLDNVGEPPDPYESWLDEFTELRDATIEAKDEATRQVGLAEDQVDLAKAEVQNAKDQVELAKGYAETAKQNSIDGLNENLHFIDENNDGHVTIVIGGID